MLEKLFYKIKVARTAQALRSLDDLALKDIGLDRSNILSHAYDCFENEKPTEKSKMDMLEEMAQVYKVTT